MRSIVFSIILLGYIITIVKCEQFYEKSALDLDGLATDIEKDNLAKRMERRAYTYMTGIPGTKRLPNYNFGLGKRAKANLSPFDRPYQFGLGKRSDELDYDDLEVVAEPKIWRPVYDRESRSRYNMGLGKRFKQNAMERRSPPERLYGFGLGKRDVAINRNDASTSLPSEHQNYDGFEQISRGAMSNRFEKRLLQTDSLQRRAGPLRYNFGLGR